ncbi:MAG: 2-dehydropantoate 2-reductase [Anaerolineales bacterium]|nr:2-dehydropantoate 2-reductase [Anaerolineales bacterium]
MKIAIMGTGGVGGYYGGLLAQQGHDVTFIARGPHLKAIQENGLQVKSIHGDFHVKPAQATDDTGQIGPVDLVIFCTKTYSTDKAAGQIRPLIALDTTVLPLQNGIDAADRIGAVLGMKHLIGGVTWISSAVEAPGIIKQISQFRRVVLGELDGRVTSRVQAIHRAFEETGITAELSENILKILWTKFVFISTASSLGALTRLPIGEYRSIPETRAMMTSLMREVEAVAGAQGVELDKDVIQKSLDFIDNAAPQIKPSMQLDVEAGRRSELEAMIGVIGRKGRELGVPTPVADTVYASLLPGEVAVREGD